MVIIEVAGQNAFEVGFVEHDHMIETLSSDRANHPFRVGILPRTPGCGEHFFDAQMLDRLLDIGAENLIVVA